MKARIARSALVVILASLPAACGTVGETRGPGFSAPCAEYWKDEVLARTNPRFEEALRCLSIGGGGP
jgi:hypothetical protein